MYPLFHFQAITVDHFVYNVLPKLHPWNPTCLSWPLLPRFAWVPEFIFYGYQNEVPQTVWLKQRKFIFAQFWKLKVLNLGKVGSFVEEPVPWFVPGFWWCSGSLWYSLAYVCATLFLLSCSHDIPVCISISVSKFPLLWGHRSYWIRTHPNDLMLIWLPL
jgi:hypothetical protein